MEGFFNPKSVVVFGASDREGNLARGVLGNLRRFNWRGKRWGIGRKACTVFDAPVFTSLDDLPEVPELAVVLTPAPSVPGVVEECGGRGIRRVIIESGGFKEWSAEGETWEARILESISRHDMRIIGPNCIGVINYPIGLVTVFGNRKGFAGTGGVSVVSQSGGAFSWFANIASDAGLGFDKGASIGNKMDVDETDIMTYLDGCDSTDVIAMYLEDVRDGRKFMDAARKCKKPIIVYKANAFPETQNIASSHTAAMAADDRIVDAALRQVGACRVRTAPELSIAMKGLSIPPMRGSRLAVVSRSGGHAVVVADRAARNGFEMVHLSESALQAVEKVAPTTRIIRQNPLDIGDVFDISVYSNIVDAIVMDPNVDGVAFIHTFPGAEEYETSRVLLGELIEKSAGYDKPVAICYVSRGNRVRQLTEEFRYPIFGQPENAIDALAMGRDWYRKRRDIETGSEAQSVLR